MVVSADNQNDNQTNCFQPSSSTESFGLVRKYMNGAIYIESSLNLSADFECKPSATEEIPIKRISCSCTSVRCCKIHEYENKDNTGVSQHNAKQENKPREYNLRPNSNHDLKVSISTLETASALAENASDLQKDEIYRKWMLKKNEEKKRIEENKIYLQEREEEQKQKRLEQERENFKRWLANKKKVEERRKREKEKQLEKEKQRQAKKERRNLECKLRYQLWLKRKEQEELEKKLREQMEIIKISDEKQRRIEENEKAFQSWLTTSKNKPKPLPPSKGLDSMRSSVSVTYINPVPWTPNIDQNAKPASQ